MVSRGKTLAPVEAGGSPAVRIGLLPLTLAVTVAAVRLTGAMATADAIGYIYLAVITAKLTRHAGVFAPTATQNARIEA